MLIFKRKNLGKKIFSSKKGHALRATLINIEKNSLGEEIFVFQISGVLDTRKSVGNNVEKIDVKVVNRKKRPSPSTFEVLAMAGARRYSGSPRGNIEKISLKDMASMSEIDVYQKASGIGSISIFPNYSAGCNYCESVGTALQTYSSDLIGSKSENSETQPGSGQVTIVSTIGKEFDAIISLNHQYDQINQIIQANGNIEKTFDMQNPILTGQSAQDILKQAAQDILTTAKGTDTAAEFANFIDGAATVIDSSITDIFLSTHANNTTLEYQIDVISSAQKISPTADLAMSVALDGHAPTTLINDSADQIITAAEIYGLSTSADSIRIESTWEEIY